MSNLQKRSRTTPRLRGMGWMSLVLSVVFYLAGSNIGSGWIVLLAAALVSATLLDLLTAWSVHRRTTVDARPVGPPRVGACRLALNVVRPHGLAALRLSTGSPSTRAVTRQSTAQVEGPIGLPRGVHRQFAVMGETIGPLGLAFTRSTWSHETDLVIRPATVACQGHVRRLLGGLDDDESRRRARREDEIQGVRPFVQGDPQRLVNWRATARHGEMMVREHTRSGGGGTFDITVSGGLWDHDAIDLACTLANSIATTAASEGHHVILRVDGSSIDWTEATPDTLATLPPAHGITPRPLAAAPDSPTPGLQLSCNEGTVLVIRPGADPVRLGDVEAVRTWLLA